MPANYSPETKTGSHAKTGLSSSADPEKDFHANAGDFEAASLGKCTGDTARSPTSLPKAIKSR